ncbi:MAG TPA: GNAT family N-acetyltransferase [Jatrophihabitans sp.]|nr:GNAT family N-acetyltransferase [Jatrophihabitans sp.]
MCDASSRFALRRARPSDRAAIEAMHRSCSYGSRLRRWRAPLPEIPRHYLDDALSGSPAHFALLAVDPRTNRVGALGSVVAGPDTVWELGLLIADEVQRMGLGDRLARALTAEATRRGARHLRAELAPENRGLVAPLSRLGPLTHQWTADGIVVTIDVSAHTVETGHQRPPALRQAPPVHQLPVAVSASTAGRTS